MRKICFFFLCTLLLFLSPACAEDVIAPSIHSVAPLTTMTGVPVDLLAAVRAEGADGTSLVLHVDDSAVDFQTAGVYTITYRCSDAYGNTVLASTTVTVVQDEVPPVISGTDTITAYPGDSIDYRAGVTVTDDCDPAPLLTVDAEKLDSQTPGKYPVVFTACDASGNTQVAVRKVVIQQVTKSPSLSGVVRRECFVGDSIDILEGVTAADFRGEPLEVQVSAPKLDTGKAGSYTAVYSCTDRWGNTKKAQTTIRVRSDTKAPTISGVHNITVKPGGTVSYKKGISCTDNRDAAPKLTVDNSKVNLSQPGRYSVVYTATDTAGNKATKRAYVIVSEEYLTDEDIDKLWPYADKVLDEILTDDMTDMEKAFKIFGWTHDRIAYTNQSDKSHWVSGAYTGLRTRKGDCFTYFSVSKALLTRAGIPSVDVEKSDIRYSRHYWSLVDVGGGWYHFDCCRFAQGKTKFFLLTDEEIQRWDKANRNAHPFDASLYPDRATESVQHLLDYWKYEVKE